MRERERERDADGPNDGPGQEQRRGAFVGLAAAALFGASTPLVKRLLPQVSSLMLAGLLYAGAGLALVGWGLVRQQWRHGRAGAGAAVGAPAEAALRRGDIPFLLGIVLAGGIIGPLLMLSGLRDLSGVSGALLLNLEAPLTALLAVLVFREHLSWRSVTAIVVIVAAGAILGDRPGEGATRWPGALSIAGACLVWALDNNLTQRLSVRDPIAVVRIKTLAAGACSLALAFSRGATLPPLPLVAAALSIGVASYGLSVVLDVYALRMLGAARESAFFATAPFVGALVAVPVLAETPGRIEWVAAAGMIGGVILLLRDRHAHAHTHDAIEHDHRHVHDDHHRHEHSGASAEPHSHPHRHQPITHAHPHNSDIHHRHRH